jgi:hypothetical protein
MPNIQFNYLYRDGGNYKKYGFVIFANPDNIDLPEIEKLVRSKLIWGEWFYADESQLPELFLETFDFKIDPTWHEFESIEYSDEAATSPIMLAGFLDSVKNTKLL